MRKIIFSFLLAITFLIFSPLPSLADTCTYNSTIANGHIDIQVSSSNFNNLGILQIISLKGPIWLTMYQPQNISWITSWNNLTANVYYALKGGDNNTTAYWGFNAISLADEEQIPYGIYGVDFSGTLVNADFYVQMDHPEDMGANYIVCDRAGDVDYSTPTPIPTITPTATPSPTPTETPTPTHSNS